LVYFHLNFFVKALLVKLFEFTINGGALSFPLVCDKHITKFKEKIMHAVIAMGSFQMSFTVEWFYWNNSVHYFLQNPVIPDGLFFSEIPDDVSGLLVDSIPSLASLVSCSD